MAREITPKQKAFADAYLETGVGSHAVVKAGYNVSTDESARAVASQNLTKDKVIEYLQSQADLVAKNMAKLAISAESEQVQVAAGKDVLDRAGYKPVDRSEVKSQIAVNTLTDEEKTKLIALLNDQGSSQ